MNPIVETSPEWQAEKERLSVIAHDLLAAGEIGHQMLLLAFIKAHCEGQRFAVNNVLNDMIETTMQPVYKAENEEIPQRRRSDVN